MHLNVRLPRVQPDTVQLPSRCPYPARRHRKQACPGTRFKLHQVNCRKPLRDTHHSQVRAQRYPVKLDERSLSDLPAHLSGLPERGILSPAIGYPHSAQRVIVHLGLELPGRE